MLFRNRLTILIKNKNFARWMMMMIVPNSRARSEKESGEMKREYGGI